MAPCTGPCALLRASVVQAFSGTAKKFGLSVDQVLAQTSLLSQILKYHLVKGTYTSKDLKNGQVLTPLEQGPSKATLTINNVGA